MPTPTPPLTLNFATLQAAIDATPNGGTLNVPAGTYRETITIRKPITINATGAVIDGQNSRAKGLIIQASNVTVTGFEVKNHTTPLQQGAVEVQSGNYDTLVDIHSHDNGGAGISINGGTGHLVLRGEFDHNKQQGYHASSTTNLTIRGAKVHHNNVMVNGSWPVDPFWEAGAGKIAVATGTVIEDCQVYANGGPGIWFDIDGNNTTIRNNKVWDNDLSGIMFEISSNATIVDNKVWHNGTKDPRGWAWPANILISSSRNVEIARNVVSNAITGISLLSQNRGQTSSPQSGGAGYDEMSGMYVHDNDILAHSGKLVGWYDPDGGSSFNDATNRGSGNLYEGPDGSKFEWNSSTVNLSGFNATRGEEGGRYLTTTEVTTLKTQLVAPS